MDLVEPPLRVDGFRRLFGPGRKIQTTNAIEPNGTPPIKNTKQLAFGTTPIPEDDFCWDFLYRSDFNQ